MPNSGCVIIYAIFLPPICTSTVLGLFSVAKGTCFWIQSDFDSEILTDCAHKALLSLNAHPLIATLSLANQTGQACVLQTNGHNYKGIQSQKYQSRNTKRLVMYWARVTLKPNTKTEGKKYFSNARIMIHIRGFSEKRTRCLEKCISGWNYALLSQSRRDLSTLSELKTQLKAHLFVLWYLASKFSRICSVLVFLALIFCVTVCLATELLSLILHFIWSPHRGLALIHSWKQ